LAAARRKAKGRLTKKAPVNAKLKKKASLSSKRKEKPQDAEEEEDKDEDEDNDEDEDENEAQHKGDEDQSPAPLTLKDVDLTQSNPRYINRHTVLKTTPADRLIPQEDKLVGASFCH
jgi:hypothetical protein